YTGGHFADNCRVAEFRRAVLNALAWAAHAEVPPGGVDSTLPGGVADVPSADPAWTPKAPAGANSPAWQEDTDADWVDGGLRQMDTGPTFDATFAYPAGKGKVLAYKGTAVKVGDGGVLFDRGQLRLAAGWTGGYLHHSDRRFGLLNTPEPAGPLA